MTAVSLLVPCHATTSRIQTAVHPCGGPSITINGQPAIDLSGFTADQQFQAGLACNGVKATPTAASQALPGFAAHLQPGQDSGAGHRERRQEPAAHCSRASLFDASIGEDNLFNGDKRKWSLRLTAVNMTNKYALYNFLSTFSGTHYVTPRALTAEVGFHF